ncbi:hypothetical protein FHG87_020360 [Trinorchestia longiramus]|nr:hypothetical protein FHG87_020360 [Trinorchestia longiramus]
MEQRIREQREAARERQRRSRQRLREDERQATRDRSRLRMQQRRMNMSQEERELHLQIVRNRDQESRNDMNEVERQQFLGNRRNRDHERGNNYMEHQIHYTGAMDARCKFCGALRFQREQLNCGHNGKVSLLPLQEYPEDLRLLFDVDDEHNDSAEICDVMWYTTAPPTTAVPLHHCCTTAPPLYHYCSTTAPLLQHHCTTTAPPLHHTRSSQWWSVEAVPACREVCSEEINKFSKKTEFLGNFILEESRPDAAR